MKSVLCLAFVFSGLAYGQNINDYFKIDQHKTMPVVFKDSPIDIVIEKYMKATGITIIKDPKIKTNLSIVSSKPLTYKEAYDALFSALKLSKITVNFEENFIVLTPEVKNPRNNFAQPQTINASLKSYQIKFASASKLASLLNSLFVNYSPQANIPRTNQQQIIQTQYVFRASSEDYSNSLIIYTTDTYHKQVSDLLKTLDVDTTTKIETYVHKLNYISAPDFSQIVLNVLSHTKDTNYNCVPETRTNSVILMCSEKQNENIKLLIKTLDVKSDIIDSQFIYKLKNAKADEIANLLQQLKR